MNQSNRFRTGLGSFQAQDLSCANLARRPVPSVAKVFELWGRETGPIHSVFDPIESWGLNPRSGSFPG